MSEFAALIKAQLDNDPIAEGEAIRALYRLRREPGRQHARVPAHWRILDAVIFGTAGSGCWHWRAATNGLGYGRFSFKGRPQGAHRVSYETFVGPIPEGLSVLHTCDNRACVNPDHLWLGTYSDNRRDCLAKGRWRLKNPRRRRREAE